MPLLRQWESDGAKFGIWKMDEGIDELQSRLVASYPYDEELSCLKAESRKLEYLSVRVLLKELCGYELRIAHHPSGKPFVVDKTNSRISISHTKGYAAVGIYHSPVGASLVPARPLPSPNHTPPCRDDPPRSSDHCRPPIAHNPVGATLEVARNTPAMEIGIDIERISERVRRASIRFIRDDELPGFRDMDSEEQLLQLLIHWSAKETMFKMLNTEGVDFQEHLRIMPFCLEQKGIIHGIAFSDKRFVINYIIEKDFVFTYSLA